MYGCVYKKILANTNDSHRKQISGCPGAGRMTKEHKEASEAVAVFEIWFRWWPLRWTVHTSKLTLNTLHAFYYMLINLKNTHRKKSSSSSESSSKRFLCQKKKKKGKTSFEIQRAKELSGRRRKASSMLVEWGGVITCASGGAQGYGASFADSLRIKENAIKPDSYDWPRGRKVTEAGVGVRNCGQAGRTKSLPSTLSLRYSFNQ